MPPNLESHREPSPSSPSDSEPLIGVRRRMLDKILRHRDVDLGVVSTMLLDLNPERAEDFLDRILEIDPKASDDRKSKALFEILGEHSSHTVPHCKDTGDIVKRLMEHQGNSALAQADLAHLSRVIERHDFGKLCMCASTLNQEHKQFDDHQEREKKAHPYLGYLLMKVLRFKDSLGGRLALTHHLKYQTGKDGDVQIVGYPKEDFSEYCRKNGLAHELTAEDQITSFVDVYSALTDASRPSDPFGMKKNPNVSPAERVKMALGKMDQIFSDPYYQEGDGAPLFQAFKKAILAADGHPQRLAA